MTAGSDTESVGERYRLEDRVAEGSSADVWRATDLELSRPVAVKLLHPPSGRDAGALDRFRASASCTASLVHEGIVRVFDYAEPGSADSAGRPFLVMELVDGPSLAELLAGGRVDAGRAMDVVAQAAAALDVAHHAGCVHGDLGPQRILLSQDGRVKLIGFGAGHEAGHVPGSTARDLAAGDLHALGVVAQLCLTGSQPPGDAALALPRRIPAPVAEFVSQLTARGPAARPATAAEVSRQAGQLRDQLAPASLDVTAVSLPVRPALLAAAGPPPTATAPVPVLVPDIQSRRTRGAARPRSLAAMPTFAVVALALAAAALFGVLKPHGDTARAGGTAMTTTVRVNAGTLTGQPVRSVRQRLERLGLLVQVRWQPSKRVSPGRVLYVRPAGSVPAHSLITLIGAIRPDAANTAPAPGQASSPAEHRHSPRPARRGSRTRPPHPTPSRSPVSSPSETPSASPSPSGDPSPSPSSPPPTSPPPSSSPSPSGGAQPPS